MDAESLRGTLLIAAPSLVDPNFARAVVLVAEHGEDGAMGLVLNRPTEVVVADAVPMLADLVDEDDDAGAVVFEGGPVQPHAVVALAEFDDPAEAAVVAFGRIGFLRADADPDEVGLGRARVFAGYAGWGPGQLEGELAQESWILEPAQETDVFGQAPADLWRQVLRRKGGAFAMLAFLPDDPAMN
jgi:putative transcriptional regulator